MTPVARAAFAALRATRAGIPEAVVAERLRQEIVALELLARHHGTWPTVAAPRFDVDETLRWLAPHELLPDAGERNGKRGRVA